MTADLAHENSENFDYYFFGPYDQKMIFEFVKTQEHDLKKILTFLGVTNFAARLSYKIYPTLEEKRKADPFHSGSYACARRETIYRVLGESMPGPSFPHEIVHLVMHAISPVYKWEVDLDTFDGKKQKETVTMDSISYLQEGLALLIDEMVFSNKLREAGEYRYLNEWVHHNKGKHNIRVREQIDFYEFCAKNPIYGTPMCGSFCMYLVKQYGLPAFLGVYKEATELLSKEDNIALIERAYGATLEELEGAWLAVI